MHEETLETEFNHIPDAPLPSAPVSDVEICILQNEPLPNYDSVILTDPVESTLTLVDETCPPPSYAEYLQNYGLTR